MALGQDPWSLLGVFFFQLFLLPSLPPASGTGGQGPMPRVKYHAGDGHRALSFFQQKGLRDFDTLLLSSDGNTLYVGAREAILALNIQNPGVPRLRNMITWPATERKKTECAFKKKSSETQCFNFIRVLVSYNATHLYACGTFAFSPACTFIGLQDSLLSPILIDKVMDGKGQSPFDPLHKHTAVLVDGMLYSGTMNNFLGSEPILMRTLGSQPVLKTDIFLRWLYPDASFVAAIPSTQVVYFFFEETASEFDFFEELYISRVARVCKNDVGGEKLLQKKWTTFLKAQLLCAQPGQLPFNIIRHAVLLPADSPSVPRIYAVFTSQWQVGGTRSSAVCAFSLTDIERVFKGKYKELNKETSRWTTYRGSEVNPRPGSCSMGPSSDKALTFMKDHFLMDEHVVGTPLLVKSGVEYTQLAVEAAQGLDGSSHVVMYLGTSTGSLHKAVVPQNSSAYLVEEIQLSPDKEPVRNLQLAPAQGAVFAGFSGGIWRVPRANCSVYESCVDCVLARDPHCAWDPESRICSLLSGFTLTWKQDMERGNPEWACARGPMARSPRRQSPPQLIKEVLTVPNSILELPCPHLSALASYHWSHGRAKIPEASSTIYNGSLLLLPQDGVGGLYQCVATENGYSYPVVSYWVDSQDQPLALDPELAGVPRERVQVPLTRVGGGASMAAQRSYWPHFLIVTVLLAIVLAKLWQVENMSTRYHQAASDSYLELLKEATKRDLNLSDEDGMTPTLLAAYHGNLEALEIICSRGGDPDKCDIWGNTPLHYAASNGHAHCISFLVNFGANIFALDNDLKSPLDAAASREQKECVALLDKAATMQNTMNPKRVARLKEQALKNARRQMKECERLQERHQNKMARTYSKEDSGTLSSSHSTFSRSSHSNISGGFGSLSKGIKDTFKIKSKKNKDTAEQVGKDGRNGQRPVMEVFREEEEDSFPEDFKEKLHFSAEEDGDVQHESILNRPGLGSIVFSRNRVLDLEDISDSKRELAFKMPSELFQRQGAAVADDEEEEEEEEREANGTAGDLPWDEEEVEWEEDAVDATPLEVFLQSQHLEEFLPIFRREQIDLEALMLCSDEDLKNIHMQLGPRKKVLNAIDKRKQVLQQPGQLVDTSL